MARQIKNKAELRAMIRAAQEKLPACTGTCFGDVCWHQPDADGCNWSLSRMEGENSAACVDAIQPLVISLQQQFNIPEESSRG
ncbi:hypothetical protein SAMN05216345_102480 [Cupriavidus sp. YR651]|uniref:hypothetical protein n=1 Tax=Cupriavidus sp. YR651 TaxID=1855315 RepID=UPI000885DDD6|nr:hypothetical protein [Cupriavidus sp. YR651]SDC48653.1 hypothetical protein SAMN05216345_102480 [Cupriavidus sp. YR651]